MEELIRINLDNNGNSTVSARELHEFLESKREFSTWIKDRIKKYGFIENQDFVVFDDFVKNPNGGRPLTEYALTIDTAKEIAMVEANSKGKQARQYFIEVEKAAKQSFKPMSTLDILKMTIQGLEEQQKGLAEVQEEVRLLKAKTTTRPDFFTIAGYASLQGQTVTIKIASALGRVAAKICKDRNLPTDTIPDPRWGTVRMYPTQVLKEVFETVPLR